MKSIIARTGAGIEDSSASLSSLGGEDGRVGEDLDGGLSREPSPDEAREGESPEANRCRFGEGESLEANRCHFGEGNPLKRIPVALERGNPLKRIAVA